MEEKNIRSKRKINKPLLIIIALLIAMLTVLTILFMMPKVVQAGKIEEQLNLGEKYLSELNYEQAVVAYMAAIEVDPKCAEAYFALVDIYVVIGEYDKAEELLEIAKEHLGPVIIRDKKKDVARKKQESLEKEVMEFELKGDCFTYETTKDGVYVCTGLSEKGYMECMNYQNTGVVNVTLPVLSDNGEKIQGIVFDNNVPINESYLGLLPVLDVTCPGGYEIYENANPGEQTYYSILLRSVVLSEGMKSIGDYAFKGCSALVKVVIPASVQHIGVDAFSDCNENLTIIAPAGSYAENYAKENGITFINQ